METLSNLREIEIYSDGSCHTLCKVGGWAALLLIADQKIVLKGIVRDSTNNRMELTAVIKALEYVKEKYTDTKIIRIYSDSQYVIGLSGRKAKLTVSGFSTKKGGRIPNADLVIGLLEQLSFFCVEWIKIKAHQKTSSTENHNIEVDKLSRKMVREAVRSG